MKEEILKHQHGLKKIRCVKCNKMLAENLGIEGAKVKCLRCGEINKILEFMIEQVIVINTEGVILFINNAVEMVTGYSVKEVIGKKPSQLWGGNMSLDFYTKMWKKILNKEKSVKLKINNKRKNGEFYTVELLISPILDSTGKIIFFVGVEIVI